MNYIGSKHKLLPFIEQSIVQVVGEQLSQMTFCDLFAGTGVVGRHFKGKAKQIITNDMEYYSFVLCKNYIGNSSALNYEPYLLKMNALEGKAGFIFEEYAETGAGKRMYFSQQNGKKIDAIRIQLQEWLQEKEITHNMYYFLLASLLESADRVANTASVYGAFLKKIKKSAAKPLIVSPAYFLADGGNHIVYQEDSSELIGKIQGDILYLDPPYNARQYGANYHLLNTIALYDKFLPQGKTGLRTYRKSSFCQKKNLFSTFEKLIKQAQFPYIFLSYNNEGLMLPSEIEHIMKKYGRYTLAHTPYQRFKADKTQARSHKANSTVEYLHILEKRQ